MHRRANAGGLSTTGCLAPKSAWGVQAQRRRAERVAQHRPGPRASIDARPRWRLTDCVGRTREAGQPVAVIPANYSSVGLNVGAFRAFVFCSNA
jgi:hypothetical protein